MGTLLKEEKKKKSPQKSSLGTHESFKGQPRQARYQRLSRSSRPLKKHRFHSTCVYTRVKTHMSCRRWVLAESTNEHQLQRGNPALGAAATASVNNGNGSYRRSPPEQKLVKSWPCTKHCHLSVAFAQSGGLFLNMFCMFYSWVANFTR